MRIVGIVAMLMGFMFLLACFKASNTTAAGEAVTIELTASTGTGTLAPGVPTIITATVYDRSNQGVTWTVSPLNFGALSAQTSSNQPSNYQTLATVTYTPPTNFSTNNTVTITATSISNPALTASIPIKVSPIALSIQIVSVTGNSSAAATQTIAPGQQLLLSEQLEPTGANQNVTWALSPAEAGLLSSPINESVTYTAPSVAPVTATITVTSVENPNASASLQVNVLPSDVAAPNVAVINVNGGAVPPQVHPNAAFTSVTICNVQSLTSCQTVDGVLVDTGSYGLRILQSQIPRLKLTTFTDTYGNILENCASNVDGSYLWGPVAQFDIYIAGEMAPTIPVQVIQSSNVLVPSGCSNGSITNENTSLLLGANGILGIGPEPTDCTLAGVNYCDGSTQSTAPNLYYSCPSTGCGTSDSPVLVASTQQVTNPVTQFSNFSTGLFDNNGTILQLPAVSGAESSVSGTLTFGIGTEPNNALGSATVFTLDSNDHFTTLFSGQTLTNSSIDSGSNALYFPDSLPGCSDNVQFFCPSSLTNLSAEIVGANQALNTVNFSVDNADNLLLTEPGNTVFSNLAGPEGTYQSCSNGNLSCVFDWGLPFFYGRSVYAAIDGGQRLPANAPKAPWWAY